MQKNLYYRDVLRRRNVIKEGFLNFFLGLSSHPRLLLEVFIRKNFGERYFSLASSITVATLLCFYPLVSKAIMSIFTRYGGGPEESGWSFWFHYLTWYAFIGLFLYKAVQRHKEIKRAPSVYDFGKFSLYGGDINPAFLHFRLFGQPVTIRQVEPLVEPGAWFIVGFALWIVGQSVGGLLMVSSLFYGFGYAGAYARGENWVMDKIDEMILNKELKEAFVDGSNPNNRSGIRFFFRRPNSREMREGIARSMVGSDRTEEEMTFAH